MTVLQIAMLATASPVFAGHSVPSVPRYWDCDNDGLADDGCIDAYKAGTGWTGDYNNRFSDMIQQWGQNTDFDPHEGTSGQPVYKDDRYVACLGIGYWSADEPLGVSCTTSTWRLDSYWDIGTAKTWMNPFKNWDYDDVPNCCQPGVYRFSGVLVHEIGHWIFLKDLNCSIQIAGYTMCGSTNNAGSYDAVSPHNDDINAADSVYP